MLKYIGIGMRKGFVEIHVSNSNSGIKSKLSFYIILDLERKKCSKAKKMKVANQINYPRIRK